MEGEQPVRVARRAGPFTRACRVVCGGLAVAPLAYWAFVTEGSAYEFFVLLVVAPFAGLVLGVNSLFCFLRRPGWASAFVNLAFVVLGAMGALAAWHFLPQFRM